MSDATGRDGGRAAGERGTPRDGGLDEALRAFAEHSPVLVALDFDGCLAPLVLDPSTARPLPEASRALRELAADDGVQLAVVSGRPAAALLELADPPPGTWLVGSHGAETGERDHDGGLRLVPVELTEGQTELLARVTAALEDIAARHPGVRVEHKPAAAVLHTRGVAADTAERALGDALAGPGSWSGVHPMRGNQVAELAVVEVSKGEALARLRERLSREATPAVVRVLYAGDDVTDETALATLTDGDLGVKVGAAETVAPHRVADEAAVAALLADLASWRRGNRMP